MKGMYGGTDLPWSTGGAFDHNLVPSMKSRGGDVVVPHDLLHRSKAWGREVTALGCF